MKTVDSMGGHESHSLAFKQLYLEMINAGYESVYFKNNGNNNFEAILRKNNRNVKLSTEGIKSPLYKRKLLTQSKFGYHTSIKLTSNKIKIESNKLNITRVINIENLCANSDILPLLEADFGVTHKIDVVSSRNNSRLRNASNVRGHLYKNRHVTRASSKLNEINRFDRALRKPVSTNRVPASQLSELESHFSSIDENNYIKYDILYGTNRVTESVLNKVQFTNKRDNQLHCGSCVVSIPTSHKTGKLERPDWFSKLLFEESKNKYFTVLENNELVEAKFIETFKSKLKNSSEKDVLLFIHGFNVNFNDAIMRTAQLGYDLNFKGVVTAFSWPSVGSLLGYEADCSTADISSLYLCDFIKLLTNGDVNKLHIIAHSMGNVVLTKALEKLKIEGNYPNKKINQIILAAPDIDKDVFINQIMPTIKSDIRLTLYASKKDNALLASKKLRYNYPRAGDGGKNIIVIDGIDTVDASKVDTGLLGHGYFASTQTLINDIHMVLQGLHPNKRILDEKKKIIAGFPKIYWAFRNS